MATMQLARRTLAQSTAGRTNGVARCKTRCAVWTRSVVPAEKSPGLGCGILQSKRAYFVMYRHPSTGLSLLSGFCTVLVLGLLSSCWLLPGAHGGSQTQKVHACNNVHTDETASGVVMPQPFWQGARACSTGSGAADWSGVHPPASSKCTLLSI